MENTLEPKAIPLTKLEQEQYDLEQSLAQKTSKSTPDILNLYKLREMFSVPNPTHSETDMLTYVYDFFDKLGVENMEQLSQELYILQSKLGRPLLGMSPLTQVYQYLRTIGQMQELNQVKKAMENNGTV